MRVKIVEPGWVGFTDNIGAVPFKNGISERPLEPHELNNIGASIRLVEYDDGVEGGQVGLSTGTVDNRHHGAPVEKPLIRGVTVGLSGDAPKTRGEMPVHPKILSDDELAEIADKRGINGMREIATQWGIKGRGINELMVQIQHAQKAALALDKKLKEKA